jgi:hypothetical protein
MDKLMALIARMIHHYNQGGAGYTWLDAAVDTVDEHGYIILNQNGDGGGPAAIPINEEILTSARKLIAQLHELGSRLDTASEAELARIDEARAEINEILAGEFEQLLLEAGLVQPFVTGEGS